VGRQTGLRHTPSLTFVRDTLPEGAQQMEDLVARARAADAALAVAREGAQPAGDPDPYRPSGGATVGGSDEVPGAGPGSPGGNEDPTAGPGAPGGPGRAGGAAPDLGR
jgi:ribosome-binding factor A